MIWGINPFDQWGVELGKQLGSTIYAELGPAEHEAGASRKHDSTTRLLMERIRRGASTEQS
jgi:glucose-6-phosphate isomerase